MKITIIGLGLIGGSMAIDLKKRGFAERVYGVDKNALHADTAKNIGLIDEIFDLEKDEKHIFDLASGGFSSTVRLAKSSAEMWMPIFKQNSKNIVEVIDTYIDKLQRFKDALCNSDENEIFRLINKANKIKRIV